MDIGTRIRAARSALGLSQADLAARAQALMINDVVEITQSSLSRIESGATRDPGVHAIVAIELALGLEPGALTRPDGTAEATS